MSCAAWVLNPLKYHYCNFIWLFLILLEPGVEPGSKLSMCPFSKLWLWPRAAALCRWLQALWHEDLLEASFADEAGLGRAPHRLERGLAATRYRKMPSGWLVWLCLGLAGTSPQSFELRGKVWFPKVIQSCVVCVVARLLRSSAPGKHLMEYNPLESAPPESKEFNESRFQEIRQLDAPWILEMEWRSRERTVLLYYANLCHIYASQSLEAWLTSHLEVDQPAGCHGFGAPCVVIDSSPLVRGEMAPKVCSRDAAELHSLNKVNAGARFQRLCICRAMRFGQGMTRMSSKFHHSHPFAPLRHHFARHGQLSPAAGARILADSGEQMRKSDKQWKTYAWKHWTYPQSWDDSHGRHLLVHVSCQFLHCLAIFCMCSFLCSCRSSLFAGVPAHISYHEAEALQPSAVLSSLCLFHYSIDNDKQVNMSFVLSFFTTSESRRTLTTFLLTTVHLSGSRVQAMYFSALS